MSLSSIISRLRTLLLDPVRHMVEMLGLVTEAVDILKSDTADVADDIATINTTLTTLAPKILTIATVSANTYSLTDADNNKLIRFTHASGCTVTVESDLSVGFNVLVMQDTSSVIILGNDGGATTLSIDASFLPRTAAQNAVIGITIIAAARGVVYGDLLAA